MPQKNIKKSILVFGNFMVRIVISHDEKTPEWIDKLIEISVNESLNDKFKH